jgi:hypothetical protein
MENQHGGYVCNKTKIGCKDYKEKYKFYSYESIVPPDLKETEVKEKVTPSEPKQSESDAKPSKVAVSYYNSINTQQAKTLKAQYEMDLAFTNFLQQQLTKENCKKTKTHKSIYLSNYIDKQSKQNWKAFISAPVQYELPYFKRV